MLKRNGIVIEEQSLHIVWLKTESAFNPFQKPIKNI